MDSEDIPAELEESIGRMVRAVVAGLYEESPGTSPEVKMAAARQFLEERLLGGGAQGPDSPTSAAADSGSKALVRMLIDQLLRQEIEDREWRARGGAAGPDGTFPSTWIP